MNKSILYVAPGFVVVILGFLYIFGQLAGTQEGSTDMFTSTEAPEITIDPSELPTKVGESVNKDGYTITMEPAEGEVQVPVIPNTPARPESLQKEAYDQVVKKLTETKELTQKNQNNTAAWLDVALYLNMLGDSKTALTIWQYLHAKSPGQIQPVANMANHYRAKQDFKSAEKYFLLAIRIDPKFTQLYSDLFEMYKIQKRPDDAIAILKKGVEADEKAHTLAVILARYYQELHNTESAKEYYTIALSRARSAGLVEIAQSIEIEMTSI